MAEVVWQARRVSDGVLVDVTGDTAGTPAGAPTPNALESGAGGGAIAVTGGGTTINDVTELNLVGSVVTDEGGGVAGVTVQTRLLGPVSVVYNAANFDNPADNGYEVPGITIPADAVVELWAVMTTAFTGSTVGDELYLTVSPAVDSLPYAPSRLLHLDQTPTLPATARLEMAALPGSDDPQGRRVRTTVACKVFASAFPVGVLSAGSLDVYAFVTEPIS